MRRVLPTCRCRAQSLQALRPAITSSPSRLDRSALAYRLKRRGYTSASFQGHATPNPGADSLPASLKTAPQVSSGEITSKNPYVGPKELPTSPNDPIIDLAYIKEHMCLPSEEEYPKEKPGSRLFDVTFMRSRLQDLYDQFGLELHCASARGSNSHISTLTAELRGDSDVVVKGYGKTKQLSIQAAYAHLATKLHQCGVLKKMLDPEPASKHPEEDTFLREEDFKPYVYSYFARYGLIPEFKTRKVDRNIYHNVDHIEVSIELESHGIMVVAVSSSLYLAENAAAFKFKDEVEDYHASRSENSVFINDSTALSLDTVDRFFNLYGKKYPRTTIEVDVNAVQESYSRVETFEARVLLNGVPLANPIRIRRKKPAAQLARLVAAVEFTQKDPSLLGEFREAISPDTSNRQTLNHVPPLPSDTINRPILNHARPIDMHLGRKSFSQIEKAVTHIVELGIPEDADVVLPEDDSGVYEQRPRARLSPNGIALRNRTLKRKFEDFASNPEHETARKGRESLPMSQYSRKVLKHINQNLYSVIVGATGSGKTTQVPQILLDNAASRGAGATCTVICTQPRRIAATSVARRVARERCEQLQATVGYRVRFDARLAPPCGSITYCTTGVLLNQLRNAPDDVFDTTSHIIVDEVHERDILIDFLMTMIKQTIQSRLAAGRPVPKIVLMSATIDAKSFAEYFEFKDPSGSLITCPSLYIPGRTFPVANKYLDTIMQELEETYGERILPVLRLDKETVPYLDSEKDFRSTARRREALGNVGNEAVIDSARELTVQGETSETSETQDAKVPMALVAATIAHICRTSNNGAILVFLPGMEEIRIVHDMLVKSFPLGVAFDDQSIFKISRLHSTVPAAEQAEVFNPVPVGCRKIILSTNIAETSVTIPEIQFVVDTGKLRENRYDQVRRITKLQCTWISKSNAKQRAGRAGRVSEGVYYALYSEDRFDSLPTIGLPEILRSDLQDVCLDVKAQRFQMPIQDFLAASIDPPPRDGISTSIENLKVLGALAENEDLTPLGRLLAELPLHPSLGKIIVLGVIFRCLDPIVILGAALSERSIFLSPLGQRREAVQAQVKHVRDTGSDHISLINAVRAVRTFEATHDVSETREFCNVNYLHYGAYRTIMSTSHQIEEVLVNAGVIQFVDPVVRVEGGEFGQALMNQRSQSVPLIKAILLAGLRPNLALSTRGEFFRTEAEEHVMIHSSSFNGRRADRFLSKSARTLLTAESGAVKDLYTYSTMHATSDGQLMLRDTTIITPLTAALFGGTLERHKFGLQLDGWLPFNLTNRQQAKDILNLRKVLDLLLDAAFQSLSEARPLNRSVLTSNGVVPVTLDNNAPATAENESPKYLADDETREAFAKHLVDILELDARNLGLHSRFGSSDLGPLDFASLSLSSMELNQLGLGTPMEMAVPFEREN